MSSTEKNRRQKLADLIALYSIDGIGATRFYQLVEAFGSATAVLDASISTLTDVPGIGRETASKIREQQNRDEAAGIVEKISKGDWKFYLYDEPGYPEPLKNIADRPPYLFCMGCYSEADADAIAIVGSRSASDEGRAFASKLASELVQSGVTIVSGMARGIDTAAHRGALNADGRTIAVFGSSLDIIYPPESREFAGKIAQSGCVFSEFLPGTQPLGPNFPRRNRIISGLSQGVIVIEAAERSGALSTASHALRQNREVFAVPGSPRHETSKGTNRLIKNGATLLTSLDDVFAELPRLKGEVKVKRAQKIDDLTDSERDILHVFSDGPVHIDVLSRELNTPVPDLMQLLLALELKGIVKELSGKRYILT
ncbi:MAG: DNA-processing protein DprA [Candidatus Zixiibacteriota bacterium]|nr:MAG: DNA-processing protein DprA [candidate division Zixibacteria bacterium]